MIGSTISGLMAANKAIDVVTHNISNGSTVGFKASTVAFSDIFPNDPSASPKTAIGAGVTTASVDKTMSQGAISATGKVTDLAITGNGFFVLGNVQPVSSTTVVQAASIAQPVVSPTFNGAGLTMATAAPQNTQTKSVELRINYGSTFKNGDFSDTAKTVNGSVTKITGWEIYNQQVSLGQDQTPGTSLVDGFPTPIDPTQAYSTDPAALDYGTKDGYSLGDDSVPTSANYSSNFDGGALNLVSSNMSTQNNGDVVHGPYVVSDKFIDIAPGAVLSFNWKADGGADAYDINAYLLKDDGTTLPLLDRTGDSSVSNTGWMPFSYQMGSNEGGKYKFVFVSGTFDYTFGQAAGASLAIDNVKVSGGDTYTNNGDTYEVNINGSIYSSGGPGNNLTFDLTNALGPSNNTIDMTFTNPSDAWLWSYDLLVNGDVVKSGRWDGSTQTSITDSYALNNDNEPASSSDNSAPYYTFSSTDYAGKARNVYLRDAGPGSASANGFAQQAKYIAFGVDGVAGERNLEFNPLDLSDKDVISMDLIKGNDSNGGEFPDAMEDLKLYYSIDGGTTFKLLRAFNASDVSYTKWSKQSVALPAEAKTSSTIIEFQQPQSSGPQYDHWGLANIQFASLPADPPPAPVGPSKSPTSSDVYTRAGDFQLDKDGYLVNSVGLKLQGFDLSLTDPAKSAIRIPLDNGTPEGKIQNISIDAKGVISATYAGQTEPSDLFQIAIATFPRDTALQSIGNTSFASTGDSGNVRYGKPGDAGYGSVLSGALEESNVDISTELVRLIRYQQIYNGNARMLQALNDVATRVTDRL